MKRSRGLLLAATFLGCLATAGCGGDELRAFLAEPRSPMSPEAYAEAYHVLPPDVLGVYSVRVSEINNVRQMVRPDGRINLPLIGEIEVAGLTPKQIQAKIEESAKKYYTEVDATVQVEQYNSQKIYVFGQVSRPGPQSWNGANTLLDVLAISQPTMLAWPERIRVVRAARPTRVLPLSEREAERLLKAAEAAQPPPVAQPKTVVDEKTLKEGEKKPTKDEASQKPSTPLPDIAEVIIVNMTEMVEKGDFSKNVLLQPDDVVFVPPNPLAAVGLAIQQILLPIRPAAETVYAPAQAAGAATGVGGR